MGDERDLADITLQLLAKAGEISVKEQQSRMPATALASRLRSGNSGLAVSGGTPSTTSSHHAALTQQPGPEGLPSDRRNVLGDRSAERQASREARGRQKDITDTASATIPEQDRASSVQKSALPQHTAATTEVMRIMGPLPIRRAWSGRPDLGPADMARPPIVEAIMVHERGEVQTSEQQCSKCRKGEGISPECIKISGIHNGACSNCLVARALTHPGSGDRPTRSYSAERRSISAAISPSIPKEDLIAVWNLIAGVISTQPQECFFDDGTEAPGKRIEDAARLVARSADEWGHTVKEGGPDSGRTPSERSKLARQASRIRETALQIASCARDWGEKLQRKRSTSQVRK